MVEVQGSGHDNVTLSFMFLMVLTAQAHFETMRSVAIARVQLLQQQQLQKHQWMVIGRRSVHGVTARPRVAGEQELILETVLTQTLASMVNIVQDLM